MKKGIWCMVFFAMVLGFVVSLFECPAYGQDKAIRLKYACFFPPAHKGNILTEQWCREVEKRTKGRVKRFSLVNLQPCAWSAGIRSSGQGIADISNGAPSWTAGRFPLSEVLELPLRDTKRRSTELRD